MGIKRSGKKKKKLGSLRASSSGSATEQSARRPKFAPKTPPCQTGCPQGTDVRGILTTIAKGEKLSIIGPSGSGKTLFGRSLINLLKKSEESIDLDRT